jgi:hypothetical protein
MRRERFKSSLTPQLPSTCSSSSSSSASRLLGAEKMGTSTTASLAAAALLLLVSLAAAADMSIVSYGERSEEETRRMYAEWMATHGRTYNAIGEEERRYQVFRDNLRYIDAHNAAADAGVHSFRLGLNRFAAYLVCVLLFNHGSQRRNQINEKYYTRLDYTILY